MTPRGLFFITILGSALGGCFHLNPSVKPDVPKNLNDKSFGADLLTARPPVPPTRRAKSKQGDDVKSPWPAHFYKPVSLSATGDVPLKELFFGLAQNGGVDLFVTGDISGGATLHVQGKPFIDVIESLCAAHGLRPRLDGGILHIERDGPFLKTYHLPFLSLTRTNQNRTSIATDVFSSVEGRRNDLDNGSNTLLTEEAKTDVWFELEENLSTLLGHGKSDDGGDGDGRTYTLHKQGGILTVYAPMAHQKQIESYIRILRKVIAGQVLIEAKIVEVMLNDAFKTGINWNTLKGNVVVQAPLGSLAVPGIFNPDRTPARDVFTIGGSGNHLSGLLNLMQGFGSVRTLSSPRLTVMNNQSAILKVATNRVFFRIDYNRDYGYDSKRETERITSEIHTVPIGLVMIVHPAIDINTGQIVMSIRPTISRVISEKADPAVAIVSKERQQSFIPEVQVREMDTVISMQSGDIAVMGGLMQEQAEHDQTIVPGAGDLPLIGFLFKGNDRAREVSELVIFLKATIIDDDGGDTVQSTKISYDTADQHLYENMTLDPRPLIFPKGEKP